MILLLNPQFYAVILQFDLMHLIWQCLPQTYQVRQRNHEFSCNDLRASETGVLEPINSLLFFLF